MVLSKYDCQNNKKLKMLREKDVEYCTAGQSLGLQSNENWNHAESKPSLWTKKGKTMGKIC